MITQAVRREEVILDSKSETTFDFTEVYRRYSGSLYGTALRLLRRPEEAEDAMQEAFMALYDKTPQIPETQLGAWLHRVLVNKCLDRIRRGRRWRTTGVDENLSLAPPPDDGSKLDLARAVKRLPERARIVFVLHDVEGFKHREIADVLGLQEGTTKSQLFRARKMLRGFMEQTPGGAR